MNVIELSERRHSLSSLFIIGNGFDIAHGIPTKYSDFRSFLIELFPEALEFRDEVIFLEDAEYIDASEFAAETLINTMDYAAGENWCDFEEALARINFNKKLPRPNHKEDETEEEDNELMKNYLLYMDMLTSGFINCSKLWDEFFRLWIKGIQQQIESESFVPNCTLTKLFSEPGAQFLSFNYTKTLQRLYNVKKVIHIHNRVGQKLIFGHGENNVTYGQFDNDPIGLHIGSSFLDNMIMSFKKDTERPLKKYNTFFKKLDNSIDKVYSYGFSYGKVDSVYIKKIIEKISPDATWYFTAYEAKNTKSLRIKKIKLRRYGFKGNFDIYEV